MNDVQDYYNLKVVCQGFKTYDILPSLKFMINQIMNIKNVNSTKINEASVFHKESVPFGFAWTVLVHVLDQV